MKRTLMLAILLGGCGYQRTYYHPTASQAQIEQDDYQCHREAYAAGIGAPNIDMLNRCMKLRGYTWKESGIR